MNPGLRGASAALLAIAARASTQLFVVAVTLVATRYLSPADFGVFAIATVFITFARTLLYTGASEYLMKTPDLAQGASECLTAILFIAIAASVGVLLLAAVLILAFGADEMGWLMVILAPTTLIAALASWEETLLLRAGKLHGFYIATVLIELASATAAIVLLVAGWGLGALVVQLYLRMALAVATYAVLLPRPEMRRPRATGVRDVLHWSVPRYGAAGVAFLSNYSGDLILGALLSPAATGLFRASNRVVTAAADMFSQPAALLSRTALAHRFARGEPPDGSWFIMFVGIGFIAWPALVGVALLGDWVALVALGPAWGDAAAAIAILSLARLWSLLTANASALLVTHDRQRFVLRVQLTAAVGVALATVVLSFWGVAGAALASLGVNMATSLWLTRAAIALGPVSRRAAVRLLATLLLPVATTSAGTIAGRSLGVEWIDAEAARLAFAVACGGAGWLVAVLLVRRTALAALLLLAYREPTNHVGESPVLRSGSIQQP